MRIPVIVLAGCCALLVTSCADQAPKAPPPSGPAASTTEEPAGPTPPATAVEDPVSLDAFIGKPCNLLSEAALSQAFPGDKVEPTATRTGSDSPGCVVDMPKGGRSLFVHLYPRSARSPLTSGFLQGKDKPGYAEGTVGGLPSVSYGAKDTQAECTVIVGTTEKSGIGVTYRHTEGSEPRGEACAIAEYALAEAIRTLRR